MIISDIRGKCQSCRWLAACRGSCRVASYAAGDIF
ncbi:MAG: hypothetical protein ACFFET_17835 [Candidatus Thorarchaeota archaeon]